MITLQHLIGVRPRPTNTGDGGGAGFDAWIKPRAFCKRTAAVALHDPDVGAHRSREDGRIVDHAGVDALHRDHDAEQQADAGGGADEAREMSTNVAKGEVHFEPS